MPSVTKSPDQARQILPRLVVFLFLGLFFNFISIPGNQSESKWSVLRYQYDIDLGNWRSNCSVDPEVFRSQVSVPHFHAANILRCFPPLPHVTLNIQPILKKNLKKKTQKTIFFGHLKTFFANFFENVLNILYFNVI